MTNGDVDTISVLAEMPNIEEKFSSIDRKDIFNADKCGLFYKTAPTTTVALTRREGRKKKKNRITVLVCAKTDGPEKVPLIFKGKALRQRVFKKKLEANYGLDYYANRNAWITGSLFN